VFFKVKTKKRPWKTSKEAITAWLWAEDKKAMAPTQTRPRPAKNRGGPVVRMGRLANISGKEAVKAFEQAGWRVAGQVGSHGVMIKPGGSRAV
jgi:hypothetical protein